MKAGMMNKNIAEILKGCVQIIDLGSRRGAWTGDDLLPIGQLRGAIQAELAEATKIEDVAPQTVNDVKDMQIGDQAFSDGQK
jgi:hypothetical protein